MSLDQLRAAFKKPENTQSNLPNNYYRFWDMKVGEQADIRFLPDANEENSMGFLVEKKSHVLTINGQKKTVPCLSMYGEECPVCKVSQEYYKHDDKVNGKKYWRKVQYLAQALVVSNPIAPKDGEENPEGQVRLISLGYSLYKIIKDAFESGELDEVPYDFTDGTNFQIKKDQQGEYASYTLSKFARRESSLDDDTIAMVKEGMVDLSTVLPKNPGYAKVEAMLEADLTGGEYVESSAQSTPAPVATATPVQESTPAPTATQEPAPVATTETDSDIDDEAEQLLAQIRQRKANKE
jgi:hypothetical protein